MPAPSCLAQEPRSVRVAALYLGRAIRLRCPTCGRTPLFVPLARIRSLSDWFTPLDGCPRCGYPYDREPGYFLLAIWGVNYGVVSLLGIVAYIVLEYGTTLDIQAILAWLISGAVITTLLFARHAKALFLAFDHFWDPHVRPRRDHPSR